MPRPTSPRRPNRARLPVALCALFAALAGGGPGVAGQASPLVDPSDRFLRADVAALAAQGVTDRPTSGLGHLTRMEAARIVVDARSGLAALEARAAATPNPDMAERVAAVRATLSRLEARLTPELMALRQSTTPGGVSILDADMELAGSWYDDADRPYPNNFLGDVDARTQPLGGRRQGRTLEDGWSNWAEAGLSARLGAPLVVHSRVHVDPDADDVLTLQQAYVRVAIIDLGSLTAGRADVVWGQSRRAGLMMSGNARSPWTIRFSTDRPAILPGFLDALGPVTGEIFWADLGEAQNFPGADLMGWHLSLRPHPRFEAGLGLVSQFGGDGAPEYGTWDVVKDLLFTQAGVRQFSNKIAGVDVRWRAPEAAGLAVYAELVVDDLDWNPGRLPEWILEDVGHVYGVEFARLVPDGSLGVWAEFHHTGHRFYRHPNFTSGLTYERDFLGNPLGPDGDGLYGGVDLRMGAGDLVEIEGGWERRSRDKYFVEGSDDLFNSFPGDDGWAVYEDFPEESRLRAVATWRRAAGHGASAWMARVGVERIMNFAWEEGRDRTIGLIEARVPVSALFGLVDR